MGRIREHVFTHGTDPRHFIMEPDERSSKFTSFAETKLTKTNFEYELKMKRYEKGYEKMCELWKPIQGAYLESLLGEDYSELGLLHSLQKLWDYHRKKAHSVQNSPTSTRLPQESPTHKVYGMKRKEPDVDREPKEAVRMRPAAEKVWQKRDFGKFDRGNNHI